MTGAESRDGPDAMRAIVRDYVASVHATYLGHLRHLPPGEYAALPLVAARDLTVVAAAARRLHLLATSDPLPAPRGPEVESADESDGVRWTVRFYDPSVLPHLGLLESDTPGAVRRVLGIRDAIYHLTVDVGGGLSGHAAAHSGVALANQHTRTARDLARLQRLYPRRGSLVDELAACERLGLDRAAALLTAELTDGRVVPPGGTSATDCVAAALQDVQDLQDRR